MRCPFCIKICTKCNRILVAYSGNFAKKKNGKYGVASHCKVCYSNYQKEYYQDNKDELLKKNKDYRDNNVEKEKERHKRYHKENSKEIKEKRKQYYQDNREHILEQTKKYHKEHQDYYNKYSRNYYKQHPEKVFNNKCKRRLKEETQGEGLTIDQWKEMFDFFEWKCAYSDESLSGSINDNRTVDHIIALNNNGEHEIWNCVPMYKSYNSSKQDRDMFEWYKEQDFYSEERLSKIYEWQKYAMNKWKNKE